MHPFAFQHHAIDFVNINVSVMIIILIGTILMSNLSIYIEIACFCPGPRCVQITSCNNIDY